MILNYFSRRSAPSLPVWSSCHGARKYIRIKYFRKYYPDDINSRADKPSSVNSEGRHCRLREHEAIRSIYALF
jgi:hypothetical protein